jgi:predicted ATPase with chaperone activity
METKTEISAFFPPMPSRLEETGLNVKFVNALLFKSIYMLGLETNIEIAARLKLGQGIIDDVLGRLKQQGFVEMRSASGTDARVARYSLTGAAKELAIEAAKQCEYVGPAPVPLEQYKDQVKRQSLTNEKISIGDLTRCLSHLILPASTIRRLGPAINSGRSLLIYGPPGNGKTAISEAIGQAYVQPIFVPHCIEVDVQVIRIFDQTVHTEISAQDETNPDYKNLMKKRPDPRWVKCRRPVVITGGELTLRMLDLDYDETSKFYEAPPQVKAMGGVFIIDDFGRQLVKPKDLLNRWIVPLEKRIDYLSIHTGKKFDVPFDELIIFSTNLPPQKLMDPALLRRVKYKLHVTPPSTPEFVTIFKQVCHKHRLQLPDDVLEFLIHDFYPKAGITCAAFHPIFIVEHVLASCRYQDRDARLTRELVEDALENLYVSDSEDQRIISPAGIHPHSQPNSKFRDDAEDLTDIAFA